MQLQTRTFRTTLIVLTIFLALTAIAGCIQLLEGTYAPPVEFLHGVIFKDFTIPRLALGLVVGGSAFMAAVLLINKNRFAFLVATITGMIIMSFEFVEVMIIGSPDTTSLVLQIFFFCLGMLIVLLSMGFWFLDLQVGR
jgi:hypothetical protein